jgi:hypothetical protein
MRRKLTLLICVCALACPANVASAIDWICPEPSCSFCDPSAWDGGVVPGPDDEARTDCDSGQGDVVIDCDFEVDRLHGPAYGGDCNQTMTIVSGTGLCNDRWRVAMEGDGVGTVNWTGGTITVDGEMRVNDDGKWRVYVNMSGTAVLIVGYRIRSGDSGGNDNQTHWNISGDARIFVGGYFRIGDDGGGSINIGGNASVTTGDELYIVCRQASASMDFSGNCEVYVGEDFRLGNPGQAAGKSPATATMTMTGGTLNAENVLLGWQPYVPADFSCTVDMTGGLIVVRKCLRIGEKTHFSCTGGEVRLESGCLEIADGGNFDICDTGVLKIKGNVVDEIAVMVCDGSGRLTGCGSPAGVVIEYDGGYTVVTGTWDPNPEIPYCPVPPDGAERVPASLTGAFLCWQPGCCVGSRGRHIVYFSTDCDCVENAPPCDASVPCFWEVCRAGETCVDMGPLELWTTYCWRVDSFCEDGRCVRGCVWSFTTGCEDIPGDCNRDCLLNFEDYAATVDDFGEKMYWP